MIFSNSTKLENIALSLKYILKYYVRKKLFETTATTTSATTDIIYILTCSILRLCGGDKQCPLQHHIALKQNKNSATGN